MSNELDSHFLKQRDEALQMLKDILDNYRDNNRKGIGMGPLFKAAELLKKYPHINGK